MLTVSVAQMRQAESDAFARGVSAEDLMQHAGEGLASVILRLRPTPQHCAVFVGKGHNGGDVAVAALALARAGWKMVVVPVTDDPGLSELTRKHVDALRGSPGVTRQTDPAGADVILDGLLGIGARGDLRGGVARAADKIHAGRSRGALVVAADLPSGLDGDTGVPGAGCVVADLTVTFGFPKRGLIADAASGHAGALEIVPLPGLLPPVSADAVRVADRAALRETFPRRPLDAHKGMCGRVGVVAGSPGFSGAAALAARGALRGGAGLVTVYVAPEIHASVAALAPAECMVRGCTELADTVLAANLDALAIGPGIGFGRNAEVLRLIAEFPGPAVVDADALTVLATEPTALDGARGPRVLTPHPGELGRLLPRGEAWDRADWARAWISEHPGVLLLKGPRTLIGRRGDLLRVNPTGNPGLASGGMGDVLTGLCAALLAQGRDALAAASLAAWLHGRAADLLVHGGRVAGESLLAGDVAEALSEAMLDLRCG
jgi:hydroxyethylthiazole kinase-like uncharacterized protein yjeF